ncbi:MAG: hypothetical protein Q7S79_01520 [bacterium]|nr:hypothetical protein [bacterium]
MALIEPEPVGLELFENAYPKHDASPSHIPVDLFVPREGQIVGAENIRLGGKYVRHHEWLTHTLTPITVVSNPEDKGDHGGPWVQTVRVRMGFATLQKESLADAGVVPYSRVPVMSSTNWIEQDNSIAPDRGSLINGLLSSGEYRQAATVCLAAAVEAVEPERKVVYIKMCADMLRDGNIDLAHFGFTKAEIIAILNQAYKGSAPEASAVHKIVLDALSSFEGL